MAADERFQVRNDEVERALRTIAALLEEHVPDDFAWGLFMARMGEHAAAPKGDGAVFWISNAERAGMVNIIRGWIDDFEKRT